MNIGQEKSILSKLRVKGGGLDPLAARLYFERLFSNAGLIPEGFPPNAIVCIRKLIDPAPQTLELNRNAVRFSDAWEKAVAREIEKLFRRAVRPVNEIVPAQAEAVVFMDKAELLACLASDFCKGILFQNWWWQSLFPNLEQAQSIARIWLESAEFAPTALQILVRQGKAGDFVNKLQHAEVSELLRQITEVFGLSKLQAALFNSLTEKEKPGFQKISGKRKIPVLKSRENAETEFLKLSAQYIPEADLKNLNFERRILLVVGSLLVCAPRIVRSGEFAEQVRQYKIQTEIFEKTPALKRKIIFEEKQKIEKPFRKSGEIFAPKKSKKSRPVFTKSKETAEKPEKELLENSPIVSERKKEQEEKITEIHKEQKPESPPQIRKEKLFEFHFEKTETEKKSEYHEVEKTEKSVEIEQQKTGLIFLDETEEKIEAEVYETVVRTRFGGIFYLLNLGLYLGLYRDFAASPGAEIDLNIWDFIALSGLEFLGEDFKDDEVWNLLKQLAGRDDDNFGEDFNAPDEWRIPAEWLKTFPANKNWLWSNTKDRLIVRHSENFNVIDALLNHDFENQLKNETAVYREYFNELEKIQMPDASKDFSRRQRWLKNLFEFVERRLMQALNPETRNELTEILFQKSATAAVSATRFEVYFRLADLPLEVRFSGLDRNPGWIPAAGKCVEFYFE